MCVPSFLSSVMMFTTCENGLSTAILSQQQLSDILIKSHDIDGSYVMNLYDEFQLMCRVLQESESRGNYSCKSVADRLMWFTRLL